MPDPTWWKRYLLRAPRKAAHHRPRERTWSRSTDARWTSPRPWRLKAARFFAGDICNTNVYDPADAASHKAVRAMFEEQVGWAVDAGVDFHHRRNVFLCAGSADRARRGQDEAGRQR
jgi:hypothetical protein